MNASKATNPESKDQSVLTMDRHSQIERYIGSVVIHGCPERVIDQIEQLREEMYLDYLMISPLSHSSFMQFTEKVMPHFLSSEDHSGHRAAYSNVHS
jgi:alkanesulfonate monooxygenase SsuD/methylene tetrahydromethanopterin reductase-like flavin-dependent oxidoreductase (luciferase family)